MENLDNLEGDNSSNNEERNSMSNIKYDELYEFIKKLDKEKDELNTIIEKFENENTNKTGSIIDSEEYRHFISVLKQKYFVDKSYLIAEFNRLIDKSGDKYVCITKPRRFGKSSIASMLIAYYSEGINSEDIFDKLNVYKKIFSDEKENESEKEDIQEYQKGKEIELEKKNNDEFPKEKEIELKKIDSEKFQKVKEIELKKMENEEYQKEKKKDKKYYEEYQKKYHTLYFDFSKFVTKYKKIDDYLEYINKRFKNDIESLFPSLKLLNEDRYNDNIIDNIKDLSAELKKRFILIIDEWDYPINVKFSDIEEIDKDKNKEEYEKEKKNVNAFIKDYIFFLSNLIKGQSCFAFVFMTGILPIAKQSNQSSLNCFNEYSMINDDIYYKYFGFTEEEVRLLCIRNKVIKYDDLEKWYNGYKSYDGEKIFNTWSVFQALKCNSIKNYWTETGRFAEVSDIINFGINSVKDEILELIKGKKISIELENYGVEDIQKDLKGKEKSNDEMRKELYSKMVAFGFLTYYNKKISIPNEELKEKFIKVLNRKDDETEYYYELIENSKKILESTLKNDAESLRKLLEEVHEKKIKAGDKIDHGNIKRVIDFAYFSANKIYKVKEEERSGEGFVDYIFYPKNKKGKIIIIELKLNGSAKRAIGQIYENKYFNNIEKIYTGNILLVGINFNKPSKNYSCIIIECDRKMEIKSLKKSNNVQANTSEIEEMIASIKSRNNEGETRSNCRVDKPNNVEVDTNKLKYILNEKHEKKYRNNKKKHVSSKKFGYNEKETESDYRVDMSNSIEVNASELEHILSEEEFGNNKRKLEHVSFKETGNNKRKHISSKKSESNESNCLIS
ncbi:hypothetical protein BCR36DRAFT_580501 [Piromyces finnis]|uniref:AAA-ATPase-like domain-containing protein n=1 Tax=Piromyces finnis TaxID=1754191 RepID=A0A1Y1VKB9_9FUNG|nr:hypothetical protein BCR36DRAFT_580501 [Piromyces finnis]|eukprot:ORX57955.1 hypothetical protein BCR36DRAFT_580501 [Piromyces finnis]